MFVPLEACTIITFSLIVLVVAVQLRRWDIIKPTLVLLFVFSGSASSGGDKNFDATSAQVKDVYS